MTVRVNYHSSLLGYWLAWHLFRLRLADRDVSLGSIRVELPPTIIALNVRIHLLSSRFLLCRERLSTTCLDACPEGRTFQLPLWHLTSSFFYGRSFFLLGLVGCDSRGRRLFEVLHIRLTLGSCIKSFSFRLEDFLADFFMLGDCLYVELPSASLGTLYQLYLRRFFFITWSFLSRFYFSTIGWSSLIALLGHLPFQQGKEILIWLYWSFL